MRKKSDLGRRTRTAQANYRKRKIQAQQNEEESTKVIQCKGFKERLSTTTLQKITINAKEVERISNITTTTNKNDEERTSKTKGKRIEMSRKRHLCKMCKIAFKKLDSLKSHQRIHNKDSPHVCKERPHVCKICYKAFSTLPLLRYHERIHTGEKPYPCEICTKAFRKRGALKHHERIHTGDLPCNKRFKERISTTTLRKIRDMLRHHRTHSEQKQENCDISKKSSSEVVLKNIFTEERSVDMFTARMFAEKRPKNSSFAVEPFGCGFCGEMFAEEDHFLMHCSHHSGEGDFSSDFILPCQRTVFNEVLKRSFIGSHFGRQLGKEEAVTGSSLRWFGYFKRNEDSVHSVSLQGI